MVCEEMVSKGGEVCRLRLHSCLVAYIHIIDVFFLYFYVGLYFFLYYFYRMYQLSYAGVTYVSDLRLLCVL